MLSERAKKGQRQSVLVLIPSVWINLKVMMSMMLRTRSSSPWLTDTLCRVCCKPIECRQSWSPQSRSPQTKAQDQDCPLQSLVCKKRQCWKNHLDKYNFTRTSWNVFIGNPPVYLNVRIWRGTSSLQSLLFRSLRLGSVVTCRQCRDSENSPKSQSPSAQILKLCFPLPLTKNGVTSANIGTQSSFWKRYYIQVNQEDVQNDNNHSNTKERHWPRQGRISYILVLHAVVSPQSHHVCKACLHLIIFKS